MICTILSGQSLVFSIVPQSYANSSDQTLLGILSQIIEERMILHPYHWSLDLCHGFIVSLMRYRGYFVKLSDKI